MSQVNLQEETKQKMKRKQEKLEHVILKPKHGRKTYISTLPRTYTTRDVYTLNYIGLSDHAGENHLYCDHKSHIILIRLKRI
jgi:hypothetical protein